MPPNVDTLEAVRSMSTVEASKIPTLQTIGYFASLPFRILYLIVRYFTAGLKYEKYNTNLSKHLRVSIGASLVNSIPPQDYHFFTNYTVSSIFDSFKSKFPEIASKLSGYGEKYDSKTIWLVKSSRPLENSNSPIIIYLHGGRYSFQFSLQNLKSLVSIYQLLDSEKKQAVSILVLDYSLASLGETFPIQKDELHETYLKLTVRDKNTNILLLGDSAGGNLALVYLQHIKSNNLKVQLPYPSCLLLISPWVKVHPTPNQFVEGKSWYENRERDLIRYSVFNRISTMNGIFGNSVLESVDVSPLLNPFSIDNWKDIPTIKKDILILAGEHESFRDDILEFSEKVFGCPFYTTNSKAYNTNKSTKDQSIYEYREQTELGNAGFRLFVEPQGVHDATFLLESIPLKKKELEESDYSDDEIFGIKRVAAFLNEVL